MLSLLWRQRRRCADALGFLVAVRRTRERNAIRACAAERWNSPTASGLPRYPKVGAAGGRDPPFLADRRSETSRRGDRRPRAAADQ